MKEPTAMPSSIHRRAARANRVGAAVAMALFAAGSAHAAETTLDFDFAQAHDYLGFGTQVWLKGDRGGVEGAGPKLGPKARAKIAQGNAEGDEDAVGMALLKELNVRFVRVSLIPKVLFDDLRPGMSVEQLVALMDRNDNAAQRDRLAAFNKRMAELNVKPVLIFWRAPDVWAEKRSRKAGSRAQAHFAKTEMLGDYANFLTAQMVWLQRHGVQAAAVELTNEPQGAWDMKYEREQYAALLTKTRATMDKFGLTAWPIAGPGTGVQDFDHYIGGVVNASAVKSLGYASAHVYLSPDVLANPSSPGIASFVGRGKFGPVMITEFGVKKHNDDDDRADDDLDVASPGYGLQAASTAAILLGRGASALIYWQLQDYPWTRKKHGMLSESGQRHPVAYAMKALFSSVPAGAKAVGANRLNAELPAVALQANGKNYLMLVNRGAQAQTVTAKLQGAAKGCGAVAKVDAFNTGGADARSAVRNTSAKADGAACVVRAELQAGTVATLVVE